MLHAECVCFNLEGEFGEEIKAILQKYTKNLGNKDISIVMENADLAKERTFIDAIVGSGDPKYGYGYGYQFDLDAPEVMEKAKTTYYKACSACHGDKGETGFNGQTLKDYSEDQIYASILSYSEGTYKGASRWTKNSVTSFLPKEDMQALAHYIKKELQPSEGTVATEKK